MGEDLPMAAVRSTLLLVTALGAPPCLPACAAARSNASDASATPREAAARCLAPGTSLASATLPDAGARSYLALGDSYTIGESVAPEDRWPVQLARALRAGGYDLAPPQIIAQTGWTTSDLSTAIDAAQPGAGQALVSLLIGVNDQFRGGTAEGYRPAFVALLNRAIALASGQPGHVIVLSIPDYGVTPFAASSGSSPAAIGAAIDAFDAVNREESLKAGAHWIDVTPISREVPSDPSLLAGDGLHPSGSQYAEWACLALPAARAALGTHP
jgi:lysophospholipase L1-like esterase